ncbi:MAG: sigma 54-interacting transcriptional regulator [Desulfovibrio sp.]|nr:sigma 54-interacting transcriptional regulator [Desulfovibrio sp.]
MSGNSNSESLQSGSNALGGLDVVLAAAHMIPQQKDMPGLLRIVRYCCLSLMKFQRICMMIEAPLSERSRLYSLDVVTNRSTHSRLEMPEGEGKYALFRQAEARLLTGEELFIEFPAAARLEEFNGLRQCLLLSLFAGVNGYHAALIFIWTEDAPGENFTTLCRVLSGIVSGSLTRILQAEEQSMEIESLREERDHLNILVGIGNVVNSTLNLDCLLDMVSLDLRRFFQVRDVALELLEGEDRALLYGARSDRAQASEPPRNVCVPLKDCLLRHFDQVERLRLLRENALQDVRKTDPLAAYFLTEGNRAVCGFPLVFRQKTLGVLLLAHAQADVFTRDRANLLSQIAVSVACAVRNAREYSVTYVENQRLAEENANLSAAMGQESSDSAIIGCSEAIRQVLRQIEMVAPSDSSVLILGETGTGKELVAEAIHRRSPRRKRPMIKFNCAAVPAGLLESELFGHEKGAFTGAVRQSKGRFELAHGSTLLLDEVGDLPAQLQPKLLRILQSRELERLGGHTVIPVDVRLVAATNRNLAEMVSEGSFREDLYYRLNVFPIHIPPLRERREDIPLLAQYFLEQISRRMGKNIIGIAADSLNWLCSQQWPGNVRELANVIERAVICGTGRVLHLEQVGRKADTPAAHAGRRGRPSKRTAAATRKANAEDRKEIIRAVRTCNGLIAGPRGAAALLGLNRSTLNSRMKKLGLDVKIIMEDS